MRLEEDAPSAPAASAARRRRSRSDRPFIWITAVGAACLIGFVSFVLLRGPSHHPAPGTAALESPPPVLSEGTPAPDFTLSPLGTGGPVSLSALRGRPVLLNFFASWCAHCRLELASVAAVARADAGKVDVVGVDSNESSDATARQLLAAAHATFPVALDPDAKVATRYKVVALPVTYFLNAQGKVTGAAFGTQTESSLRRGVARAEASG
jgi:cytochrome c biogenesis protein CcmG/thiol:disulfide interchange protein DsbE